MSLKKEEVIGGKFFKDIIADDRVTSDLAYCLFCNVTSHNPNGSMSSPGYRIPLDSINTGVKQCPSCKRIYLLNEPY